MLSDDSIDSYGEIVEQEWILDRFKNNPTVLYSHNRQTGAGFLGGSGLKPGDTFPVGRIIYDTLKKKGNKSSGYRLIGKVEFVPESVTQKMGDDGKRIEAIWALVSSGFLKAGSVGFFPHDVRRETHDDADVYILSKNELFEFSICPIGANANAVANSSEEDREARREYLEKRAAECAQRSLEFESDDDSQAASGQETSDMTEAEFKAKVAELEAKLEASKTNEKAALELAQQNETKATEATERAASAEQERDTVKADLTKAQESIATLTAERDTFESEAIEAELKALVGKKFHASEIDDMREDRKSYGKEKFAERMERRADLSTGKTKIPEDTTKSTLPDPTVADGSGKATSEYLNQAS